MTDHLTPEEHSDIVGGSTAARRIGCPASYSLEKLVPKDERGSEYAREGTALHELMAMALRDGVEPTEILPYTFTAADGSWSFTVDRALWDAKGEPALAAFDRFCAEVEAERDDDMHLLVERRVAVPGIRGAFGTSDVVARCGDEIFVMDWKFGFGEVTAEDNKQLQFYAVGALNTEVDWIGPVEPSTPVTLVIIQPMNAQRGAPIISKWTTSVGALDEYVERLQQAVAEAQAEAPRIARGDWCKFARCKTVCPRHLDPLGALGEKLAALKAEQETTNGSPDRQADWSQRYAELLDLAEAAEPMVAEIFAQAHAYAEQGGTIDGWGLEAKKPGARSWGVAEDRLRNFFRRNRIKIDQWTERKVRTPAQIEKILKPMGITLPDGYVAPGVSSGTKLARTDRIKRPAHSEPERMRALADKLRDL